MTDKQIRRMVITGGSGFVGWNLCIFLKGRHEIFSSVHTHAVKVPGCQSVKLDITDREQVLKTISTIQPAVIIHTAAISSPELCERDKPLARAVNVDGIRHILEAAAACSSRVVFISTDLVFDGETGNYSEASIPNPVNYYGVTKREGEQVCLQSPADAVVIRITLQYGWGNGMNASSTDWLMASLTAGTPVSLFTDQYRTLTHVRDTAQGIELAALHAQSKQLYHLTGPQRISRYEFGLLFAEQLNLPRSLIKQSCMADVPALARRPRDVSLDGHTFLAHFNFQPHGIREGLAAMAQELLQPVEK